MEFQPFILPFFYMWAYPWVIKHLIECKRIANWKPKLKERLSISLLKATYCERWQRIRYGEEVNLPIIVKELKEKEAILSQEEDKILFDEFEFYAWETNDGFAIQFPLKEDEHLYGLGERFYSFDLRGKRQVLFTVDTIGSNSSYRMYKPVPFLLSSAGYGIFVNTASMLLFDTSDNKNCFIAGKGPLDIWRIKGSPKEIISYYTELTGRAPILPKWSFGLWLSRCMYPNRKTIEQIVNRMREEKIPCDVISLDPLWLKGRIFYSRDGVNFEWNTRRFPNPSEMIKKLQEKGIKLCLWINPYLPLFFKIYKEAKSKGYLVKKNNRVVFTIDGPGAIVDFSNEEGVKWYKDKLVKLLREGVAVFKTDYGEGVPQEASSKVYPKIFMHNIYPLLYNRAVFDTVKEIKGKGVVWARSAWAGSQRYPLHWSGDPKCNWKDLRHSLIGGLNLALSGFAYWSNDIGGFIGKPSKELYIRWSQFGLFVSNSRLHGVTAREPWVFGDEALQIFKYYAKLRYSLVPYLYTYAHIASQTGHPILRPMVFEFPEDKNTYNLTQQYMLGAELLIAPVLEKGQRTKEVYFPEGNWLDWYSYKEFQGPKFEVVPAPLSHLPIFVRKEAIIPLLSVDVNFVDEKKDELTLLIFNPVDSSFTMFEDEDTKIEFLTNKKENEILLHITPCRKSYIAKFYKIKSKKVEGKNVKIHEVIQDDNFLNVAFKTFEKEAEIIIKV